MACKCAVNEKCVKESDSDIETYAKCPNTNINGPIIFNVVTLETECYCLSFVARKSLKSVNLSNLS